MKPMNTFSETTQEFAISRSLSTPPNARSCAATAKPSALCSVDALMSVSVSGSGCMRIAPRCNANIVLIKANLYHAASEFRHLGVSLFDRDLLNVDLCMLSVDERELGLGRPQLDAVDR